MGDDAQPVHAGHLQVGDDQVRLKGRELRETVVAISGNRDLVAFLLQDLGDAFARELVIVDH